MGYSLTGGRAEREGACLWEPGGKSRGAKSLRPDLRTANSEGGRTSYWQGPEQTRQRTARTVFQALRGSPTFCVSRSKARSQVIWPRGICRPAPKDTPLPAQPCCTISHVPGYYACHLQSDSCLNDEIRGNQSVSIRAAIAALRLPASIACIYKEAQLLTRYPEQLVRTAR